MRIGLISDTHGRKQNLPTVIEKAGDVVMWLHAGDCQSGQDVVHLRKAINIPVIAVAGNNDLYSGCKFLSENEFIEVDTKKIWLTHGHRQQVKWGLRDLAEAAKGHEADIVVFGHTHEAYVDLKYDVWLINPGSLAFSFAGKPSFAILTIDETNGFISTKIIEV